MIDEIQGIARAAEQQAQTASSLDHLRSIETDVLGKRSPLTELKKRMGDLDAEQRKTIGQALNQARATIEAALQSRRDHLEDEQRQARLAAERLDLTEFETTITRGHLHLVTQTRDRLEDLFVGMGFTVSEGPEAESDWYNFEALNFPAGHPARTMYDTIYLDVGEPESTLLRTHTSPVQIRVMQAQEPPIYSIMPGRVYRRDTADASHMPVFHQIEGLVIDKGITFADLAGTLETFTSAYFGGSIQSRLRPSYFPFTEPSAEPDVWFPEKKGGAGWVEWGGCGMVNRNVLRAAGIDPDEYQGFAFGMGIERTLMFRNELTDMRDMIEGDVRFSQQFGMVV